MSRKATLSICLAIALPIASYIVVTRATFDPAWLALPDALISGFMLHGLRKDPLYAYLLTGLILLICLVLFQPDLGALLSSWVFLLISRYFAITLNHPQRQPLITQMARRVRGPGQPLSEAALAYTQGLTRAWSLLFCALSFVQIVSVFLVNPSWSWIMANTFAPCLIFLFLMLEPIYRRYRMPLEPRHSFRHFLTRIAEDRWHGAE